MHIAGGNVGGTIPCTSDHCEATEPLQQVQKSPKNAASTFSKSTFASERL